MAVHSRFLLLILSIPFHRAKRKRKGRGEIFFFLSLSKIHAPLFPLSSSRQRYKMPCSVRSPSRRWRTHNSHALSAREYEEYQRRPSCYFKRRNTGDTKEKKRKDYGPRRDAPFRMWMFYESRVTGKFMKHASSVRRRRRRRRRRRLPRIGIVRLCWFRFCTRKLYSLFWTV